MTTQTEVINTYIEQQEKELFWGEIFINISEIKRLYKYDNMFLELDMKISHSKNRIDYLFYFILVHGLLHLANYDDKLNVDRLKMLKMGKKLLIKTGIK
jgi:ssRNA-specific RNase YbeY (16S rRNA maturation enzyme)